MSFKLISHSDIKELTKRDASDNSTTHDPLLADTIIPAVGDLFAHYCHRPDFDKASRTEYFSPGREQSRIFLRSPPVVIAAADDDPPVIESPQVFEDTASPRAYGAGTKLVHGTDYFLYAESGYIERIGRFPFGVQTVKAIYTGGYLTADGEDVPADLKFAAMMQVKILFDRREEYGVSSRSLEGGSMQMLQVLTLPMAVKIILDKYVVPREL